MGKVRWFIEDTPESPHRLRAVVARSPLAALTDRLADAAVVVSDILPTYSVLRQAGEQTLLISTWAAAQHPELLDDTGVLVDMPWRLGPRPSLMNHLLSDGKLGPIGRVAVASSGIRPEWGDEAAPHDILLAQCWLAIERIAAWIVSEPEQMRLFPSSSGMMWTGVVRFMGGSMATWDCGIGLPPRQWVEIVGEAASMVCDDLFDPTPGEAHRFWIHGPNVMPAEGRQIVPAVSGDDLLVEAISNNEFAWRINDRTRMRVLWQMLLSLLATDERGVATAGG